MSNSDIIINDGFIFINDNKYKCIFIDENTVEIDGLLIYCVHSNALYKFLSNKNVIISKCNQNELYIAENIKNSNIIVKKLMLHYQSTYFKYDPEDRILKERPECFDYINENNSKVKVEGYFVNSGLDMSVFLDRLYGDIHDMMHSEEEITEDMKIKFVHSDKLIDIEDGLKKYFKY